MEQKPDGIVLQRKHIVIIAAVLVLLIFGGIILGTKLAGKDSPQETAQSQTDSAGVELDANAGEYTGELPKKTDTSKKGIQIPGYPTITIEKDTQDVQMALLNPEDNPCYFKFVIELKSGSETVFESKYVKPGDCIYNVHLTRALPEGEYPAVIKISTLSLDGKSPMNGANVETVLIAK